MNYQYNFYHIISHVNFSKHGSFGERYEDHMYILFKYIGAICLWWTNFNIYIEIIEWYNHMDDKIEWKILQFSNLYVKD